MISAPGVLSYREMVNITSSDEELIRKLRIVSRRWTEGVCTAAPPGFFHEGLNSKLLYCQLVQLSGIASVPAAVTEGYCAVPIWGRGVLPKTDAVGTASLVDA